MKMRMKNKLVYILLLITVPFNSLIAQSVFKEVDICIYGGTSAGVIAAYTAEKQGKSVLLIEPRKNLGGMSSGGLGHTDIGNKYVVTGLAKDFYRRLGKHYGTLEQWVFEPKVAEEVFAQYIKEANVNVLYGHRLNSVKKNGSTINEIVVEATYNPKSATNKIIKAKVFLDCTYEGDLMAKSGVSYTTGREDNSVHNETYSGVQLMKGHQFNVNVDPYIIPGDSTSGLVWGVSNSILLPNGTGDKKIQAYNFRIALTNKKGNIVPIKKPENYDPKKYELLIRLKEKTGWKGLNDIFIWSMMPNGKTDINHRGGFSTDAIGMNWNYPDGTYGEREKIWKEHVDYTKGLLYFVGNDPRVPEKVRTEMKKWGYPKDEYVDNGHWSHQLYIREARRMVGALVMTENHCIGKDVVTDAVGWAAYTMDSHNCDRLVVNGFVKNEGNVEIGGFDPFPISYRAITPKKNEASNLLVPVCMSASHIAYGSIRMEPVFMVLAQSAALAACMAIDENSPVQKVDVAKLQKQLKTNPLSNGSIPEILVDNEDANQVVKTGNWSVGKKHAFGLSFLYDKGNEGFKSVKFIPEIENAGMYDVYIYTQKRNDMSDKTSIKISGEKGMVEKSLSKNDIVIEGQTSSKWISLGEFKFEKGNKGFVEVNNNGANGMVIADAMLFVPQVKK